MIIIQPRGTELPDLPELALTARGVAVTLAGSKWVGGIPSTRILIPL